MTEKKIFLTENTVQRLERMQKIWGPHCTFDDIAEMMMTAGLDYFEKLTIQTEEEGR